MRCLEKLLPFVIVALPAVAVHAQKPVLTLQPDVVVAGSPEILRVTAPAEARIDGEWDGHPLHFFHPEGARNWYAIAGADVEAAPGPATAPSTIRIVIHPRATGEALPELRQTVEIHPAHYRTTSLTVAPKFVEPDPEALKQIKAEIEIKKKVWASSADHPLWNSDFAAPVSSQATDSFGTRRMLNGKLAATHKGMDFRAPTGTIVRAGNAGVVVLAQPLYYEGNCVIVDHGDGLMSLYMHFSRIDVKPGQQVGKGEKLGLSGATGRVTGPHLHWAIRWEGAMLDPAKVLKMDLGALR